MRTLTRADRIAWRKYEAANKKAADEYALWPSVIFRLGDHRSCLCCRIQTEQFGVCLSCQSRDPEWAEVAGDLDRVIEIRKADMFPLQPG